MPKGHYPRYTGFDLETVCFIVAEIVFGTQNKDIAKTLQIKSQTICRVCRRYGIYRRPSYPHKEFMCTGQWSAARRAIGEAHVSHSRGNSRINLPPSLRI